MHEKNISDPITFGCNRTTNPQGIDVAVTRAAFSMPSGNILCREAGNTGFQECWIKKADFVPVGRPSNCAKADWGHKIIFSIAVTVRNGQKVPFARFVCNTGHRYPQGFPTRHYGQVNIGRTSTCSSQTTGLTCTYGSDSYWTGFHLNRAGFQIAHS